MRKTMRFPVAAWARPMGKLCVIWALAMAALFGMAGNVRAECLVDAAAPALRRPIDMESAQGFGMAPHPIFGFLRMHHGVDFRAAIGTPILAAAGGKVVAAERSGESGNRIVLQHVGAMETHYAHQSRFAVAAGHCVVAGQVIGYVGSTGLSVGPHLHFEVHVNGAATDPAPLMPRVSK